MQLSTSLSKRCDRNTALYHSLPPSASHSTSAPSQAYRGWSSNLNGRRDQYLIFCP